MDAIKDEEFIISWNLVVGRYALFSLKYKLKVRNSLNILRIDALDVLGNKEPALHPAGK